MVARVWPFRRPTTGGDLPDHPEWIREMLERARYGEWPIWVVPVLAEPNVLFCRARGSTSAHRLNSSIRRGAALQLSEEPFPTWVG